jgi:hypothetical protein
VQTVWIRWTPPVSPKKFHLLQRASQGRQGTKGDHVQPVTTLYICKKWLPLYEWNYQYLGCVRKSSGVLRTYQRVQFAPVLSVVMSYVVTCLLVSHSCRLLLNEFKVIRPKSVFKCLDNTLLQASFNFSHAVPLCPPLLYIQHFFPLLGLFSENGGSIYLRNIITFPPDHRSTNPRRLPSSWSLPCQP